LAGKAQQTVDNAQMRYFIVHLHRLLDPDGGGTRKAKTFEDKEYAQTEIERDPESSDASNKVMLKPERHDPSCDCSKSGRTKALSETTRDDSARQGSGPPRMFSSRRIAQSPAVQKALGILTAEFLRLVWWTNRLVLEPADFYERSSPSCRSSSACGTGSISCRRSSAAGIASRS
jgi:hypothetical protein